MVEMGKHDALGKKKKPEAVYYYCGRMGGGWFEWSIVTLLLLFLSKEKYEMVKKITDSHVQFGHPKCIHSKQTLWMWKTNSQWVQRYLLGEGLKNYNIPLPPVISRRIGKYHKDEYDSKRLCEWHFPTLIPKGEAEKGRNLQGVVAFVAKYLGRYWRGKELLTGAKIVERLCVLCHVSKLYHTQRDYKLHAKNFRQGVLQVAISCMPHASIVNIS